LTINHKNTGKTIKTAPRVTLFHLPSWTVRSRRGARGALRGSRTRSACCSRAHFAYRRLPGDRRDVKRSSRGTRKLRHAARSRSTPPMLWLQDFTGVPAVVRLAAMRSAMERMGRTTANRSPGTLDLVVDHSVIVDEYGSNARVGANIARGIRANRERYELLSGHRDVQKPPRGAAGHGIVSSVNLEYLARGSSCVRTTRRPSVPRQPGRYDSHTTMINGLGVVGWGVGGIEAEAVDARRADLHVASRRGRFRLHVR